MAFIADRIPSLRTGGGRRSLTLGDQLVSSGSNFLLAVFVAQTVDVRTFGIYALLASIYWLALGGTRALIGEPLLILRNDLRLTEPETDAKASGAGLIVGFLFAVPLLLLAVFPTLRPYAVLAIGLPILLWQDVTRYVFFARQRPAYALAADVVWLISEAVFGIILLLRHDASLQAWVGVWVVSALLSVLFVSVLGRLRPRFRGWRAWARRLSGTSSQLFADFAVTIGAQQTVVFALPLVASLSVLGALKAAQVAVGPLSILNTTAVVLAIPAVAQATHKRDFQQARRSGVHVALALFAAGLVYAAVGVSVPSTWGGALFQDSWTQGSYLIGYVACQFAFIGLMTGAIVVLRGTRNTRRGLIIRLFVTPVNVILPLLGAYVGGTRGLGICLVLTAVFGAVVWWSAAWTAVRQPSMVPEAT